MCAVRDAERRDACTMFIGVIIKLYFIIYRSRIQYDD